MKEWRRSAETEWLVGSYLDGDILWGRGCSIYWIVKIIRVLLLLFGRVFATWLGLVQT